MSPNVAAFFACILDLGGRTLCVLSKFICEFPQKWNCWINVVKAHSGGLIGDQGSKEEEPGPAAAVLAVCSAVRRGWEMERAREREREGGRKGEGETVRGWRQSLVARQGMPVICVFWQQRISDKSCYTVSRGQAEADDGAAERWALRGEVSASERVTPREGAECWKEETGRKKLPSQKEICETGASEILLGSSSLWSYMEEHHHPAGKW